MLPSYLHNNVFSAPNWTFVHGFCVLVPNYVANHVVFWSNFCRESRCFGDTFRPLKKLLVTQKGFFAGLAPPWCNHFQDTNWSCPVFMLKFKGTSSYFSNFRNFNIYFCLVVCQKVCILKLPS